MHPGTHDRQRDVSHREVLAIALPLILSNLSTPLVGLVDTAVVGHLDSPESLGGVAIGASLFNVLFTGLNFLRMGTTGLAAQARGANSATEVSLTLARGLVVALCLAVALIVLQHPVQLAAFSLLSPPGAVAGEAEAYFDLRIWAAPATLSGFVLSGWFIGLGRAWAPLAMVAVTNLVNVGLDVAFVRELGMRADGVALATVCAEYLGVATGLAIAVRMLARHGGRPSRSAITDADALHRMFAINGNLLLRTLVLVSSFAFLTAMGARQGPVILAANAVLLNFLYLASYALDGFANAAEALVGRAVGARDGALLRHAILRNGQWSIGIAVPISIAFAIAGPSLIDALTSQAPVAAAARDYLPWLVLMPLVGAWAYLFDGVFVGATLAREMRNTMLIAAVAVYLPAWWLLRPLGNHGLWLAFILFNAARGIAQAVVLRQRLADDAPALSTPRRPAGRQ
jgi:MATE family multidrug resistance protein